MPQPLLHFGNVGIMRERIGCGGRTQGMHTEAVYILSIKLFQNYKGTTTKGLRILECEVDYLLISNNPRKEDITEYSSI